MAILDRVKERVETDLTDAELTSMIAEVVAEIDARFGAVGARTTISEGIRSAIYFQTPLAGTPTVVEIDAGDIETTLAADDYRLRDGGRTLERLASGTNPRTLWDRLVKVTYTPASNQAARDEVVIKVIAATITYRGLDKNVKFGDFQAGGETTAGAFNAEREALIASLAPSRGIGAVA